MNVIVAVNSDWGIGFDGKQSIVLPEDRRFFRETTSGGVIIAGRKTFEDFPGPLPNRKNIVLTRDKYFSAEGVTVLHSIEEVLEAVADADPEKVFIAGGGGIYEQFLPLCGRAYVTKLSAAPESDTFFPNLDELKNWSQECKIVSGESGGIKYSFYTYKNRGIGI